MNLCPKAIWKSSSPNPTISQNKSLRSRKLLLCNIISQDGSWNAFPIAIGWNNELWETGEMAVMTLWVVSSWFHNRKQEKLVSEPANLVGKNVSQSASFSRKFHFAKASGSRHWLKTFFISGFVRKFRRVILEAKDGKGYFRKSFNWSFTMASQSLKGNLVPTWCHFWMKLFRKLSESFLKSSWNLLESFLKASWKILWSSLKASWKFLESFFKALTVAQWKLSVKVFPKNIFLHTTNERSPYRSPFMSGGFVQLFWLILSMKRISTEFWIMKLFKRRPNLIDSLEFPIFKFQPSERHSCHYPSQAIINVFAGPTSLAFAAFSHVHWHATVVTA